MHSSLLHQGNPLFPTPQPRHHRSDKRVQLEEVAAGGVLILARASRSWLQVQKAQGNLPGLFCPAYVGERSRRMSLLGLGFGSHTVQVHLLAHRGNKTGPRLLLGLVCRNGQVLFLWKWVRAESAQCI